jgi:hypothetical protein
MSNAWGELRETELSGVAIGLAQVLVHATIDAPYEWVHGRQAPKAVFPSLEATHAAVAQLWGDQYQATSGAFYVRSVPSVILETKLGAVMVVDVWGDSKYRAFTGKAGLSNLKINRSIGAIIDAVRASGASRRSENHPAEFFIDHIDWQPFDPFPRGKALSSFTSCVVEGVGCVEWIEEANATPRAHMGKVLAGFHAVNSDQDIRAGQQLVAESCSKASQVNAGLEHLVDVGAGIAQIEAFLRNT